VPQLARAALALFLALAAVVPSARACTEPCDEPAGATLDAELAAHDAHEGDSGERDSDCGDCGDCGDDCAACPCCAASVMAAGRFGVPAPSPSADRAPAQVVTSAARRHVGDVFQPPRA
jgi:hypothetical protein